MVLHGYHNTTKRLPSFTLPTLHRAAHLQSALPHPPLASAPLPPAQPSLVPQPLVCKVREGSGDVSRDSS